MIMAHVMLVMWQKHGRALLVLHGDGGGDDEGEGLRGSEGARERGSVFGE